MKSVKEMAELSGVSVRALHYYDEIDLLKPTYVTSGGYRQYSNADIARLQKIVLLKEIGFSLTDIKKVMANRNPDTQRFILEKQKDVLILKSKRIENLIQLIDSLLEGSNVMIFEKFNDDEIRRTFDAMMERLNEDEVSEYIEQNGGSMESAKKSFMDSFENYDGDLKYYLGDKDMEQLVKESPEPEEMEKSREILSVLYEKLGGMVNAPINDTVLEVIRQIYEEMVAMFPVGRKDELFQEMAELYAKNEDAAREFDKLYGKGTAKYYYKCVKEFLR